MAESCQTVCCCRADSLSRRLLLRILMKPSCWPPWTLDMDSHRHLNISNGSFRPHVGYHFPPGDHNGTGRGLPGLRPDHSQPWELLWPVTCFTWRGVGYSSSQEMSQQKEDLSLKWSVLVTTRRSRPAYTYTYSLYMSVLKGPLLDRDRLVRQKRPVSSFCFLNWSVACSSSSSGWAEGHGLGCCRLSNQSDIIWSTFRETSLTHLWSIFFICTFWTQLSWIQFFLVLILAHFSKSKHLLRCSSQIGFCVFCWEFFSL